MSNKILTPEQERYVKTALATSNSDILGKFGTTAYINTAEVAEDLTTTTHPAGSIIRCTGGLSTFTLDASDDSYAIGDELQFVQTKSTPNKVVVVGSDTGGSLGAPIMIGNAGGGVGIGKTRTMRKVSNNGTVVDSPLETTADELLTSITVDVTGGSAGTYTTVALTTGTGGGAGAQVTCVLSGASAIDSITVTTAGTGYSSGDTLTIAAALLGGSSTEVTIVLDADDVSGTVEAEWDIDLT